MIGVEHVDDDLRHVVQRTRGEHIEEMFELVLYVPRGVLIKNLWTVIERKARGRPRLEGVFDIRSRKWNVKVSLISVLLEQGVAEWKQYAAIFVFTWQTLLACSGCFEMSQCLHAM